MKFRDAVRHLEDLGLAVVMPNGKLRRTRRKLRLRNPVRIVPVRVLKDGSLPQDLRKTILESRAEVSDKRRARKNR